MESLEDPKVNADVIMVLTSVADRADAERIAASLVAQRLAACVKLSGPVESTYRWKGRIESSREWQCTIKTLSSRYDAVVEAIRQLHSYEEPEILAVPIVGGSDSYLHWIADSVRSEP